MSTLRVTYLKNQAAPNNTVTFDANNLVTVTGNVNISSPLGSNGNLTVANNITSSGLISDSKGELRDLPVNNQTGPYLLTISDHGKMIAITTGNVFVPNAIFSAGDNITVYNNSASSITITHTSIVTGKQIGRAHV